MRIELQFFDGCPNHHQALANLSSALGDIGLHSEIKLTRIASPEDAVAKRFLGSPSIQINGQDLEFGDTDPREYAMNCRRYQSGVKIEGYPPTELIRRRLISALKAERDVK